MTTLALPARSGTIASYTLGEPASLQVSAQPATSRSVYAAAHIVADPLRASAEGGPDQIDWDRTLRLRHRLWDLGLGVAEAMDTSQRGMGLDWPAARELGRRSIAEAAARDAKVVVGIATDQLSAGETDLAAVQDAYLEQLTEFERAGGEVVLMASRQLAGAASDAEDYLTVYDAVLREASRPVILHWLGDVFDPALGRLLGSRRPRPGDGRRLRPDRRPPQAGARHQGVPSRRRPRTRASRPAPRRGEAVHRRRLPLHRPDRRRRNPHQRRTARRVRRAGPPRLGGPGPPRCRRPGRLPRDLGPTETLSRLVFAAPTQYYKVGVAWLAYLEGAQDHFRMIGGFETGRSLGHLGDLVRAADGIGLFPDPDFTARRAPGYFAAQGIG